MRPILAGLDTEYGLSLEGRTVHNQIEDAREFVEATPGDVFCGWDARDEAPRSDLRGFQVERLSFDPTDAQFDAGASVTDAAVTRADRVLPNGARFYNDHGHPEYATPECWSARELALHDKAGEMWLRATAAAYRRQTGRRVRLTKNTLDYHGASWGAHESYLAPRALGFEGVFAALAPLLVVRPILVGAGRVGGARNEPEFEISQRAQFITERASVDTLFRRPLVNTRDEPHAARGDWMRVHVIPGDANMAFTCTRRKVALVQMALALAEVGHAPAWDLADPVKALHQVSRNPDQDIRIELVGGNWTTARFILESYCEAAREHLEAGAPPVAEWLAVAEECLMLTEARFNDPDRFARHVEWACKRQILGGFLADAEEDWHSDVARSLDLAWHDLDPDEGLYAPLAADGYMMGEPSPTEVVVRMHHVTEPTRAFARSTAVRHFREKLVTASWGRLTLGQGETRHECLLPPDLMYSEALDHAEDVESFVSLLRGPS